LLEEIGAVDLGQHDALAGRHQAELTETEGVTVDHLLDQFIVIIARRNTVQLTTKICAKACYIGELYRLFSSVAWFAARVCLAP
jgi:hypothetical protein